MKGYTIQNSINVLEEKVEKLNGSGGAVAAESVTYDNTTSGLLAENVQAALDELAGGLTEALTGSS